jgi:hypothetical protein
MIFRVKLIRDGYELEIPANPYPMYPYVERLNNTAVESATGERYVIDEGPTRVNASIIWNAIHYDVVKQYEYFLLERARMGLNPFAIICPHYIDFGEGLGVNIYGAYYAGSPTLKDIITPRGDAGLYYDIELPYMFVREENV